MYPCSISDVSLIGAHDPGYRAFVARKRAEKAACRRIDPKHEAAQFSRPTEILTPAGAPTAPVGRLVEKSIKQWLGCRLKSEYNTILTWREQVNQDRRRCYAELDFVHRVDYDTLVLFEIKFTTQEWMLAQRGAGQLNQAERILHAMPGGRNVLKRLVYVGDGSLSIPHAPAIDATDLHTPYGVVWVDPARVEALSLDRGAAMPENWQQRPFQSQRPWLYADGGAQHLSAASLSGAI